MTPNNQMTNLATYLFFAAELLYGHKRAAGGTHDALLRHPAHNTLNNDGGQQKERNTQRDRERATKQGLSERIIAC